MNVLLVDDSVDILEGIKSGVNFKKLGITHVYTALNICQAKALFNSTPVDIMVTDIEMLGGSGLELLEWVRDQQLKTITMFCTCYADFNYAKKAIELHSFDYFLKPISYSALTERLSLALDEVKRIASVECLQKKDKEIFWSDILSKSKLPDHDYAKQATEHGCSYQVEDKFVLCIINLYGDNDLYHKSGKDIFEKRIRNIIGEASKNAHVSPECTINKEEDTWYLILRQTPGLFEVNTFVKCCNEMVRKIRAELHNYARCYYVHNCVLGDISPVFRKLSEVCLNDVCNLNGVFSIRDYKKKNCGYQPDFIREMGDLLLVGKSKMLIQRVSDYLDELVANEKMDSRILKYFSLDMMQIVNTVLKNKQIEAHRLFGNETYERLREKSYRSVMGMKKYLRYMVETAANYLSMVEQSQSVAQKMIDYIDAHLDENINRGFLSKIVFLNQDYLARIFKKETGKTISEYLLEIRISRAKNLLEKTDLPVNGISLKVGYTNFSYFTKLFHDRTGYTPTEFRNIASGKSE